MTPFKLLRMVVPALALVSMQAVPHLRGAVDLTIGRPDADDNYTFGRIVGLALGADGRIFVADNQDQQVRVFGADGKFIFKFGAKGSGPGEFTYLGAIAFGPDGQLWTRDEGNFRYQSFAVSGTKAEYRSTRRMLQHARGIHDPIVFDATGNVVEIGRVNAPNANAYQRTRTTIDAQGTALAADTTSAPPNDSVGIRTIPLPRNPDCKDGCVTGWRYLYQPFAATPLIAFAPTGEVAEAISSRYSVSWTALHGKRIRLLQRDAAGVPPTPDERAKALNDFDATLAELKMTRATAPFGVPALKPPLRELKFSVDGELWVQRTMPAGKTPEADVYDKSGRLVAIADWPVKLQLLAYNTTISGRTALAVARDSLDTETVVRVRFK